jgi:type II secretory pathway pseudopilin PulG
MMNRSVCVKKQTGFTLVEIAIVLIITGLLIGGILRGQELINSARARNMMDQKSSIQTAMVGFMNRYKAMPGDLTAAQRDFIGNGVIASTVGYGNGIVTLAAGAGNESVLFFQNLAATSFLSCTACMNVLGNAASTTENSPNNISGLPLQFGTIAGSARYNCRLCC